MQVRGHDIGVCSWSLLPSDMADLIAKVRRLELSHVQLGLAGLLALSDADRAAQLAQLRDSGIVLTSTSMTFPGEDYRSLATFRTTVGLVADEHWPVRRGLTVRAAKLTADLGLKSMEFHIGFIPASSVPAYDTLVERVRQVALDLAQHNVDLLIETGEAAPSELLQFLNDTNSRNVAVNFDPANMILFGAGDPIDAVRILSRHIRHIHLKDAVASEQPRMQWGTEVPLGEGDVELHDLLDALDQIGYRGPMSIERQGTSTPIEEIKMAIELLAELELSDS